MVARTSIRFGIPSHRSTHRVRLIASLFISLIAFAGPAAAAPPSTGGTGPEQEACAGRASGDACTLPNNQLGTCTAATCNRLDYSGGSPPKAIEEACVVCQAAGGGPHDGPPMLGGDGSSEPPADSKAADSNPDVSSSAGTKEPPESSSRCQVSETPSPAGGALLAGLLLIGVRRRSP